MSKTCNKKLAVVEHILSITCFKTLVLNNEHNKYYVPFQLGIELEAPVLIKTHHILL